MVFHLPYCLQYINVHNRCFISASSGINRPWAVSVVSLSHRMNAIFGPQPNNALNDLSSSLGALILNGSFSRINRAWYIRSSAVGAPAARDLFAPCTDGVPPLEFMVKKQQGVAECDDGNHNHHRRTHEIQFYERSAMDVFGFKFWGMEKRWKLSARC